MKKKQFLIIAPVIIICFLFLSETLASTTSQYSVVSQGSINYHSTTFSTISPSPTPFLTPTPTPIPTSKPTATPTPTPSLLKNNLVQIPNGWTDGHVSGWGIGNPGSPFNILDSTMTYNGQPTVKIDCSKVWTATYQWPECDGPWITTPPGTHIHFEAYVKIDPSTIGDKSINDGAIIGMDFFGSLANGAYGRIGTTQAPDGSLAWTATGGWNSHNSDLIVRFGTTTWKHIIIDFIVPATITSDLNSLPRAPAGTVGVVDGVIPWLTVYANNGECTSAWFADTQFYVN